MTPPRLGSDDAFLHSSASEISRYEVHNAVKPRQAEPASRALAYFRNGL
jgi:hypothetical protein